MPSAIDITKPIYGTPTTQSVRDNFTVARDEITDLQDITDTLVNRSGDTMNGPLILYGPPYQQNEAATLAWVLQQLHSTINALIYIGDYDGANDLIVSSNQPQFVVGQPLPAASPSTSQFYFTVKTGHASPGIGHQPPEGVSAGTFLISNGTHWINFAMTAANVTAKTVPVDAPAIPNVPGATVYDALYGIGQDFLPKSGGALTGFLTLNAAPTSALHASTKKYVDDSIAALIFPNEAPVDTFSYTRANAAWSHTPTFDRLTLDTNTWGHLKLNSSIASATANQIIGLKDNNIRWVMQLGDGQANQNFGITRYNNAGVNADSGSGYIFQIDRLTGTTYLQGALSFDVPIQTAASISGRGPNNPTDPNNDLLVLNCRSSMVSSVIALRGPTFSSPNSIDFYTGLNYLHAFSFRADGSAYFPGAIFIPVNQYIYFASPGVGTFVGLDAGSNFIIRPNADWQMYYSGANGFWIWDGYPNHAMKMQLDNNGQLQTAGNIIAGDQGISFVLTGSTVHRYAFGWNGLLNIYVDASYQGDVATTTYVSNNYLRRAGDTASGQMITTSDWVAYGGLFAGYGQTSGGFALFLSGNDRVIRFSSDNWRFQWVATNGTVGFLNNASTWLYWCDGVGNFSCCAQLASSTNIVASQSLYAYGEGNVNGGGICYQNIGANKFNFSWDGSYIYARVDNAYSVPIASASDERIKANIELSTFDCLAAVMATPLYQFRMKNINLVNKDRTERKIIRPRIIVPDKPIDAIPNEYSETVFEEPKIELMEPEVIPMEEIELLLEEPRIDSPIIPIGFIAQRQHKIFPASVVKGDDDIGKGIEGATTMWTMDHNTLCATLFGAVQQLYKEVLELKGKLQ